jgi:DNA primase
MSDLDAIRDRVDIVELVGETVRLQRAGRTYKGLCPFHSERTPSFIVSPERRTWHCFGACSTGGDVFSFVMRRDNVDFGEAVRRLAARAGVPYESRETRNDEAHARLIQANEAAASYYHNALLHSAEAAAARAYAEKRGLDAAAIEDYQIGYSPESWDALATHLHERQYVNDELVEAGLLVRGERGDHDRFRARLIFPIRDARGRVVGFGGRALGDAMPKYLNSPQTPIFDKSGLLYLLDRAGDPIRRAGLAVIVEGYLDAIAAHQHGYGNVVASLGTALNERHIGLLKRYARSVALALDADDAGVEAAARGEQLIREMGADERVEVVVDWGNLVRVQARAPVDVRIFSVPSGKDPDEAIRADPAAWPQWVEGALPPFEFRLRFELARLDRSNPRERLQLLDRLLPLLADVSDRALQAQYLSELATSLAVREEDVRARLNATLPASRRGQAIPAREPAHAPLPQSAPATGVRTESFCLALLLRFERLRSLGLQIDPDLFVSTPLRRLFELWRGSAGLSEDAVPDELRQDWQAIMDMRMVRSVEVDSEAALSDCVQRMELRRLELQKRLLTAALAGSGAGSADDTEESDDEQQPDIDETLGDDVEVSRHLHRLEYQLRTRRELPPSLRVDADDSLVNGQAGPDSG